MSELQDLASFFLPVQQDEDVDTDLWREIHGHYQAHQQARQGAQSSRERGTKWSHKMLPSHIQARLTRKQRDEAGKPSKIRKYAGLRDDIEALGGVVVEAKEGLASKSGPPPGSVRLRFRFHGHPEEYGPWAENLLHKLPNDAAYEIKETSSRAYASQKAKKRLGKHRFRNPNRPAGKTFPQRALVVDVPKEKADALVKTMNRNAVELWPEKSERRAAYNARKKNQESVEMTEREAELAQIMSLYQNSIRPTPQLMMQEWATDGTTARGNSPYDRFASPETREKVLEARLQEMEAFAASRSIPVSTIYAIAEASMRTGKVPDLGQYGLAGDDAVAVKHFVLSDVLNIQIDDEDLTGASVEEGVSGPTRMHIQKTYDTHRKLGHNHRQAVNEVSKRHGVQNVQVNQYGQVVYYEQADQQDDEPDDSDEPDEDEEKKDAKKLKIRAASDVPDANAIEHELHVEGRGARSGFKRGTENPQHQGHRPRGKVGKASRDREMRRGSKQVRQQGKKETQLDDHEQIPLGMSVQEARRWDGFLSVFDGMTNKPVDEVELDEFDLSDPKVAAQHVATTHERYGPKHPKTIRAKAHFTKLVQRDVDDARKKVASGKNFRVAADTDEYADLEEMSKEQWRQSHRALRKAGIRPSRESHIVQHHPTEKGKAAVSIPTGSSIERSQFKRGQRQVVGGERETAMQARERKIERGWNRNERRKARSMDPTGKMGVLNRSKVYQSMRIKKTTPGPGFGQLPSDTEEFANMVEAQKDHKATQCFLCDAKSKKGMPWRGSVGGMHYGVCDKCKKKEGASSAWSWKKLATDTDEFANMTETQASLAMFESAIFRGSGPSAHLNKRLDK